MNKTKNITLIALFAVITALASWICFPLSAAPLTLQVFAVALSGYLLGKVRGTVCILVYLIMGAVGLPVFSSFRGGIAVLLSPTGGFLWGFLALSFFCGLAKGKWATALGLLGLLICHAAGVLQYSLLADISILAAFLSGSLPFIAKDIILVVLAQILAARVKKETEI